MGSEEARLVEHKLASVMYDLVKSGLQRHRVSVSELTEYYLVALLSDFSRMDRNLLSRSLGADLLATASLEPSVRYAKLKDIADTSLFLAGVFLDHIEAQAAATDYFFDIGSRAYLDLGGLESRQQPQARPFVETYNDLGNRFDEFAGVLSVIADERLFASSRYVLGIYQRWLNTGNHRDAKRLVALGIIPCGQDSTKVH